MEQIIRAYGKFLLDAAVVSLLLGILLANITDAAGNRGIFHIAGAYLTAADMDARAPEDFAVFREEGKKGAPVISYQETGMLHTGRHVVSEYIKAIDHNGQELPIRLLEVCDAGGNALDACNMETTETVFPQAGIYTVKVLAVDAGNRRSVSRIRLPVNE